jgi:acyl-CoA synthetase (AMP-forming)/AMP-acid ligase II
MTAKWPNLLTAFQHVWIEPERAQQTALADELCSYSYAQLHDIVGRQAGALRDARVDRGDRVALAMERSAKLAIAILAVMAAGACPCPIEPTLGPDETRRRAAVARFDWVLADAQHRDDDTLVSLTPKGLLDVEKLSASAPCWATDLTPQDDAFLLFTSGSSGKPKGVLQNHRGLLTNSLGVIAHSSLGPSDRLLHVMPLHHTNGVNNQLLAPLLAGASVFLAGRFRAENMPELMAQWRPTIVTGVPTMYSRMLAVDFVPEAVVSLRLLRCGSAPITEELQRRIEHKFGLPLVVSYGLSEATCTSTMNPPHARRIGSVGTVLQGQDVFLRGPDGERVQEVEREGEICISGPALMKGYLEEGGYGVARSAGTVLRTGDLGRFDDEGYLYITGRLKDVIIRGGENLSPNLIEEALATVPGVMNCCVVGRAHTDLGEVPVAFVVRKQDAAGHEPDEKELGAAVLARLSRIHQPAEYFFIDALPENTTGKVDRKKLRDTLAVA